MKRPWMPFYVADYLQDTAHLSPTEHGAYLLLILHYWTKNGLPTDPKTGNPDEESIRRITRLTPRQWGHSCDLLRSLFLPGWRHKRIDSELVKAIEKSKVNSANARRSHGERSAIAERTPTQSQSQSEDESLFSLKTESPSNAAKPQAAKPQKQVGDWPPDYREQWWAVYPRKTEKKAAMAKLDAIHKAGSVSWSRFMAGVNRYAMHIASTNTEERYVKHPTTWLNRGCWDDEFTIKNGGNDEIDRRVTSIKSVHGVRAEIIRRSQARAAAEAAAGGGQPGNRYSDSSAVVELEAGDWSASA